MKKSPSRKKIILIATLLLIIALLFSGKILTFIYQSKQFGYLLDIKQIENSCATEMVLSFNQKIDTSDGMDYAKRNSLALNIHPVYKTKSATIDLVSTDWQKIIKEGRQLSLISTFLLPPPPLEPCK